MTLAVIGAGFGRTGTLALKLALEQLGYDKCYHMMEIQEHPEYTASWNAAVEKEKVDWDAMFAGYKAAVDWPVCYFWQSLVEHYPSAKVILTVRDPDHWYDSVSSTIYQSIKNLHMADEATRDRRLMAQKVIMETTFDNKFEDRTYATSVFEKHIQRVQESIPRDRLLTYEVVEGWEPLCAFLDKPRPLNDFPRTNSRQEFRSIFLDGS